MKDLFKDIAERATSRKLWVAVLGALAPYFSDALAGVIDPTTLVISSAGIVISYLLGQSAVDVKRAGLTGLAAALQGAIQGGASADQIKAIIKG